MQLDLNFSLKKSDGSEYLATHQDNGKITHIPILAKSQFITLLEESATPGKLGDKRAWDFAKQLSKNGIIETDVTGLEDFMTDVSSDPRIPRFIKMNLLEAIDETKKKGSESSSAKKDECCDERDLKGKKKNK